MDLEVDCLSPSVSESWSKLWSDTVCYERIYTPVAELLTTLVMSLHHDITCLQVLIVTGQHLKQEGMKHVTLSPV